MKDKARSKDKVFSTEQESFWAGEFGNNYALRNSNPDRVAHLTAKFSKILSRVMAVHSCLEIGANVGQNIQAIRNLIPNCTFSAVEINSVAREKLELIPNVKVFKGSVFDFSSADLGLYDMTYTAGVLIHINPAKLSEIYEKLYACSRKYILVSEYYNPEPVEIAYRGHQERLYKRDFAGDLMDKYPDLTLVDYGFQYHRDNNFPADDSTWFLLKKCIRK